MPNESNVMPNDKKNAAEAVEEEATHTSSTRTDVSSLNNTLSVSASAPHMHKLMEVAVKLGASDLHISSGKPIHYRLDGKIHKLNNNVMTKEECQYMLFEIISKREQQHFIESWELDKSYQLEHIGRFRINMFMQKNGLAAAMRLIPNQMVTLEQLKLPPAVKSLSALHKGLILVTGATGSGKSTTLAAMLDYINRTRNCHIITIEDPIEFVHKDMSSIVNQRELATHTKTFQAALKAALREDPDIIMVGELRDLETIALAITAAETGHLVLSTVHSSNAAGTLDRVIDVFPPSQQAQIRTMLSTSLKGIISQKLFPILNNKGRVPAFEILINTPAVGNLIRESKVFQLKSVIQTGAKEGMISFEKSLHNLITSGLIDQEQAESFLGKEINLS